MNWSGVNGLRNQWIIDKEMSEDILYKNEIRYFNLYSYWTV